MNGQECFISFSLSIQDTGIGISKQGLDNLFINFGKLNENS